MDRRLRWILVLVSMALITLPALVAGCSAKPDAAATAPAGPPAGMPGGKVPDASDGKVHNMQGHARNRKH